MDQMKNYIINEVEKMPENWDGFELRAYISKAMKCEEIEMSRKRKACFKNDCIISNLRY